MQYCTNFFNNIRSTNIKKIISMSNCTRNYNELSSFDHLFPCTISNALASINFINFQFYQSPLHIFPSQLISAQIIQKYLFQPLRIFELKFETPPRSSSSVSSYFVACVRVSHRQPSFKNLRANEVKRNRDINRGRDFKCHSQPFRNPCEIYTRFRVGRSLTTNALPPSLPFSLLPLLFSLIFPIR